MAQAQQNGVHARALGMSAAIIFTVSKCVDSYDKSNLRLGEMIDSGKLLCQSDPNHVYKEHLSQLHEGAGFFISSSCYILARIKNL